MARTVRHFWPGLNGWIDELPDTRFEPFVIYKARFLVWWALMLYCCRLGSRRQLDFQLRENESHVLENFNVLASTQQESLPVHKTLAHFLSHSRSEAIADLRTRCVRQLIRGKVLDFCRLSGRFVVAIDGSGFLSFRRRHCPHCLHHRNASADSFLHPVLEAKIVDPSGLAVSIASEFIENAAGDKGGQKSKDKDALVSYENVKQDCELNAFLRLAPRLKADFPRTPLCLAADSLMACGPVLSVCEDFGWSYVLTFKAGRTPALWADFLGLLKLHPENRLRLQQPDGTRQVFDWVNAMDYTDSEGRHHRLGALRCQESDPSGLQHTFAWITDMKLHHGNVAAVATRAGRSRFKIENQGFNTQKNSGLNLEHAYSTAEDSLKAFYYLLQMAHLFLQMLEMGSLLRQLAKRYKATPSTLFGSARTLSARLLECLRYFRLGAEVFTSNPRIQIRLDTS